MCRDVFNKSMHHMYCDIFKAYFLNLKKKNRHIYKYNPT